MSRKPSAKHRRTQRLAAILLPLVALSAPGLSQSPPSEETVRFFAQNCASCHTIGGGRLAGPDLKGVHERRPPEWLVEFISNPQKVIDSGDPYAAQLLLEARGVVMPTIPGVGGALADKLVELIRVESALERSRFAGLQLSDRPLTAEDVALGERLFLGRAPLANGAPACVGCHTVAGLGALGGGRLGPDLTDAYARLEGRKALAAWLAAPPSPVMQPVFRGRALAEDEVLPLVAYLKSTAESGATGARSRALPFALGGVLAALALLVLLDFLWRKRYRATRRPLVSLPRRRVPAETHA